MPTQEVLKTVDKLADAGVTIIAFSGGEPLMRKDLFEALKRAREYGVFTAIATNGTLITKEEAEGARPALCRDKHRWCSARDTRRVQGDTWCLRDGHKGREELRRGRPLDAGGHDRDEGQRIGAAGDDKDVRGARRPGPDVL